MDRSGSSEARWRIALRRALRPVVWAASVALLLVGCSDGGGERQEHFEDEGPLAASSGEGRTSVRAQESTPHAMSFGAYLLCVNDPGEVVELERVTYEADVEPAGTDFVLRTVRGSDVVMNGEEVADEWGLFGTAAGRPPDFENDDYLGSRSSDIAGTTITQPCTDFQDVWLLNGYTDLLVVVESDGRGARIPRLRIDYRVGDESYTLITQWEMIMCGSEVVLMDDAREVCWSYFDEKSADPPES